MSASCRIPESRHKITFGTLARHVLSLDPAIEWVALEEAGREPRWAWLDSKTGDLRAGSVRGEIQIVDPLLFLLADGWGDLHEEETDANPHPLLFLVLAYPDMVQIVARLRPSAHITVAAAPRVDAHVLGTKLIGVLDRCARPPVVS